MNKRGYCGGFLSSSFFCSNCSSFQQLLQKDPELRLSSVKSLKSHAYFSEISFEDVLQKKVSPFSDEIISRQT